MVGVELVASYSVCLTMTCDLKTQMCVRSGHWLVNVWKDVIYLGRDWCGR